MHQRRGWSSILAWIGVAALAAAFLVFVAGANPQPESKSTPPVHVMPSGPEYGSDSTLTMARIRKLAADTHGDWNAVSETDRHLIDGLTGGHGRSMFKMITQDQKAGHQAPTEHQRKDRP